LVEAELLVKLTVNGANPVSTSGSKSAVNDPFIIVKFPILAQPLLRFVTKTEYSPGSLVGSVCAVG